MFRQKIYSKVSQLNGVTSGSSNAYCKVGCQPGYGDCYSTSPAVSSSSVKAASSSTSSALSTRSSSTKSTLAASSAPSCVPQKPFSTNYRCGPGFGTTCLGYEDASCCSQYGYCGSSSDYCGKSCQAGYGNCAGSNGQIVKSSVCSSSSSSGTSKATSSLSSSSSAVSRSVTSSTSLLSATSLTSSSIVSSSPSSSNHATSPSTTHSLTSSSIPSTTSHTLSSATSSVDSCPTFTSACPQPTFYVQSTGGTGEGLYLFVPVSGPQAESGSLFIQSLTPGPNNLFTVVDDNNALFALNIGTRVAYQAFTPTEANVYSSEDADPNLGSSSLLVQLGCGPTCPSYESGSSGPLISRNGVLNTFDSCNNALGIDANGDISHCTDPTAFGSVEQLRYVVVGPTTPSTSTTSVVSSSTLSPISSTITSSPASSSIPPSTTSNTPSSVPINSCPAFTAPCPVPMPFYLQAVGGPNAVDFVSVPNLQDSGMSYTTLGFSSSPGLTSEFTLNSDSSLYSYDSDSTVVYFGGTSLTEAGTYVGTRLGALPLRVQLGCGPSCPAYNENESGPVMSMNGVLNMFDNCHGKLEVNANGDVSNCDGGADILNLTYVIL